MSWACSSRELHCFRGSWVHQIKSTYIWIDLWSGVSMGLESITPVFDWTSEDKRNKLILWCVAVNELKLKVHFYCNGHPVIAEASMQGDLHQEQSEDQCLVQGHRSCLWRSQRTNQEPSIHWTASLPSINCWDGESSNPDSDVLSRGYFWSTNLGICDPFPSYPGNIYLY